MKFLFLALITINTAIAGFPIVKVMNISGEYEDKKGMAYAEIASYELKEVKISHKNIDVKFNKIQKSLVLRDTNTTVELNFDFDFLNVFSALSFSGVDIFSAGTKLNMYIADLNIFVEKSTYHLNKISLNSDITQYNTDGSDISILNGLLLNGEVKINYVDFGKSITKSIKEDLVENELSELIDENLNKVTIPVLARYINLKLSKGAFSGAVLLDSWVNAWVRMNGIVTHKEKENKLIINLQKAKLGWFSVKNFLLKRVRNMNIENISVEGSNIIINLENVFSRS